jgi:hypothetical protein
MSDYVICYINRLWLLESLHSHLRLTVIFPFFFSVRPSFLRNGRTFTGLGGSAASEGPPLAPKRRVRRRRDNEVTFDARQRLHHFIHSRHLA